jgi:subtilisin family serine protease
MIRFLRFAALTAIASCVLAIPFLNSRAVSTHTVSVIVEFNGDPAAVYSAKLKRAGALPSTEQVQAYRNNLTAAQDQFLAALKSRGINAQATTISVKDAAGNVAGNVALRYTLVYNGLTLTVPETAIPTIAGMSGVKKIHDDYVFHPNLFKSVPYIGATKLYGSDRTNLTPSPGVPGGNQGEGIFVSVIDTGIDWTHPMFGGDQTPPRLGVLGDTTPSNKKVVYQLPLADIVTDGFGHGTHVASTIAGYLTFAPGPDAVLGTHNNSIDSATGFGADDIQLNGVAPQAKLMSYKVCSDSVSTVGGVSGLVGGCVTSSIIMAIEDSVSPITVTGYPKPIAHVISMSLGGGGGPEEPTAVASDNATLPTPWNSTGTSVVAAAGNDGEAEDPQARILGAPSAGRRVIAVAASNDPGTGANTVDVTDGSISGVIAYPLGGSAPIKANITNNFVFCGLGETAADFPAAVRGRIALVQRGSTVDTNDVAAMVPVKPPVPPPGAGTGLFATKTANATAAGAVAVVFYNNVAGEITAVTAYKTAIPALGISKANGERLKAIATDGTGVSAKQIRINKALFFAQAIASFSSIGPVQGFGQVKPDVAAPGVNILAAAPPASALAALAAGENGLNYIAISGTSMATPHTSGAVALLRSAHITWTPDQIRTAMINSSTNLRSEAQVPQAEGLVSINSQGGGLIDIYHAVNLKALMGETGDGVTAPEILGSHSYGEVPVVNNRVTSTQSVTVTIQDLSGQGGTYNLGVADSQDSHMDGVSVTTSPSSVSLPAGGSATFTVNATFDGNLIRDPNVLEPIVNGLSVSMVPRPIQMQWYVTAQRAEGGESLRMPFYYKPVFSQPAYAIDEQKYTGTVAVGTLGSEAANGVDYVDVPFTIADGAFKLDADITFPQVVDGLYSDLDVHLLDSAGNVVKSSAHSGGPEHITVDNISAGNYRYRVDGFLAQDTSFEIISRQFRGNTVPAPTLAALPADATNAAGDRLDFDGNVILNWTPHGAEQGFEIEQSTDYKDVSGKVILDDEKTWQILGDVNAASTSFNVSGLADGRYFFRVHAIYPGQIGQYVSAGSSAVSIVVSGRTKVDITSQLRQPWPVSNVSCCNGGVWQEDVVLINDSGQTFLPFVEMNIIGITSASGNVRVINAENGKDGRSPANAALFSYTQKLGSDEQFTPNETTGSQTMRFQDTASEGFYFDAVVTAYVGTGSPPSGSSSSSPSGGSGSGVSASSNPLDLLTKPKAVMRFTVNPLTKTVTSKLISLK